MSRMDSFLNDFCFCLSFDYEGVISVYRRRLKKRGLLVVFCKDNFEGLCDFISTLLRTN